MLQETIRRRVRRGARYLDQNGPKNWRKKVTDDLNMADGFSCVLGQVFGDYMKGLAKLERREKTGEWFVLATSDLECDEDPMTASVIHGFTCPPDVGWTSSYWGRLEMTWRRELGLDRSLATVSRYARPLVEDGVVR